MTIEPDSSTPIPLDNGLTPLLAKVALIPIQVTVGDHSWQLTVVPDQAVFFEVYDAFEDPPHGFLLWESAIGLARFLDQQPRWVRGKRVLELGAGVGLPGLVAQQLGAEVWQTDHQSDLLALTALNGRQNGDPPIQRFLADWRRWTHTERYPLILGADILYDRALHFYLEHIFHRNLEPGGRLLLADPGRVQALEFMVRLEEHGWRVDLETLTVPEVAMQTVATAAGAEVQNRTVEVTLYSCTRTLPGQRT